jgi:hypothetical protein
MKRVQFVAGVFTLACLLAPIACDDDEEADTDTGHDAASDGGTDTVIDTAEDTPVDTSVDTAEDTVDVQPDVPVEADFSCQGNVERPVPDQEMAEYEGLLVDYLTEQPVETVTVVACAADDYDCENPVGSATTDVDGIFVLALPLGENGFDGYLQVDDDLYVPSMGFFNPPLTEDTVEPRLARLITTTAWETLAGAVDVTLDETRGHIAAVGFDCNPNPAAEISFLASTRCPQHTHLYRRHSPQHHGHRNRRIRSGWLFQRFPGPVRVTSLYEGDFLGAATLFVRPGTISLLILPPSAPALDNYACVGVFPDPVPTSEEIDYTFRVVTFLSEGNVPDITVNACALDDVDCETPIDTATSDEDGLATVTLPTTDGAFDGYLEIEDDMLLPTLVFFNPPISEAPFGPPNILVLPLETWEGFYDAVAVTPIAERGQLGLQALECPLTPGAGMSFEADTDDIESDAVYIINSIPSLAADATDFSGLAGIFNVPVGPITVTGTVDGQEIGTATAFIRAGTLSEVAIYPTPAE